MLHLIQDALLDTVKLLPFLYLTYLAMEYLEHHLEGHTDAIMKKAGRFGPLVGGLLGVVPQCGFSTVAANLYAGRIITVGTLLAVFLSTSDEMLPIMISRQTPVGLVLKVLVLKAAIAVAAGFLVDAVYRRRGKTPSGSIGEICDHEHCHCEESSSFVAALRHTVSIGLFILLINFLIGLALHLVGEDVLTKVIRGIPMLSVVLAAIVGLIPNCAVSVAITTLYLDGLLSFGAMMAGLLVGAGMGILVLLRINRSAKDNVRIIALLLLIGIVCGAALDLLGIVL